MRGWKVNYAEDEGLLEVGPTRGKPRLVRIVGIGTSPREEHHYLLYDFLEDDPEELAAKAEEALCEYLGKHHGGSWDLIETAILSPHWSGMSGQERDRLLRREGFEATRRLPE